MKLKSVAVRGTFLLSLLGTFGHPASALEIGAVGIDAPASESADVCQSAGPGVQICREVVNPVTHIFEARSLSVIYTGRLLVNDSSRISAYVSLNGQSTQTDGQAQAVPMYCARTDLSRGNPDGTLSCSLTANSYITQPFPYLFTNAPGDQPWNVEVAFFDAAGNIDKSGDQNYRLTFAPAQQESKTSVFFNYTNSLTYQAAPKKSLLVQYLPGGSKVGTGSVFMGAMINGRVLPPIALSFNSIQRDFTGMLSLDGVEDGALQVWFYDSQGNYDSDYGNNYEAQLKTK